ncbi:MAG TPA: hypothetical protein VFV64_09975 [Permianibacter sp.]|nr:hypothetical protein [Permianibacter sp.]
MLEVLALVVVMVAGLYFVVLAAVAVFAPERASRFFMGFANSVSTHYLELLLRLLIGLAFLYNAEKMPLSTVFVVFGWLLVVTTAVLLLVPWQWHRRFAVRAVPKAISKLGLIAASALIAGVGILAAALTPLVS